MKLKTSKGILELSVTGQYIFLADDYSRRMQLGIRPLHIAVVCHF